jgi:MYXO-CTERM domain-containing protein
VTTLAGSAGISGVFDGTGPFALFNLPQGVAADSNANVYVVDTGNNSIRKVNSRGVVTTVAGIAGITGSRDGAGSTALFNQPQGLLTTPSSGDIVVVDTGNSSLRYIVSSSGLVSTFVLKAPTTTTTTTDTSSSSSSGGGGAPSTWFLAALGLLAAGRRLGFFRRQSAT